MSITNVIPDAYMFGNGDEITSTTMHHSFKPATDLRRDIFNALV